MRLVIGFVVLSVGCSPSHSETKDVDVVPPPSDSDRHCQLAMEFASRGTCLAAGEQLAHCQGPREPGARAHAEKLCPPTGALPPPEPPPGPGPPPRPPRPRPDGPSEPGTPERPRPSPSPDPTNAPEPPRPPTSPRPPPYVIPSRVPPLPPMPGAPPPAEPLVE